jgi:hypothetical protein
VECDEVAEYLVIRMPFGVPSHHGTGMLRGEGFALSLERAKPLMKA